MTLGGALILLWVFGGVLYSLCRDWRRGRRQQRERQQYEEIQSANYYQKWKLIFPFDTFV
jgi:hypothetical protein